jgi:large subunit ribosomal protein L21
LTTDYAIIEMGGKQYRVEKGDSVLVDRIDAGEGDKVSPRAVLFRSDKQTLIDGSDLAKVKVEAVVAEHVKGEKVRIFKYRPKKRYRRRAGHRSHLTRIEIREIKPPSAGKPAAASTGTAKAAAGSAKETKREPAKKKEAGASGEAKKPARKPAAKEKEDT